MGRFSGILTLPPRDPQRQPLGAVKSQHPFVVHHPALATEQDVEALIAVARSRQR
jgi:hypothetical protein